MKIISIKVVFPEIEINTTPLEKIIIDSNSIIVLFDDIYENRYNPSLPLKKAKTSR